VSVRQSSPLSVCERESFLLPAQLHHPIELIENSMRGFRQDWRNQNRDDRTVISVPFDEPARSLTRLLPFS
jgi:hypothetical protein